MSNDRFQAAAESVRKIVESFQNACRLSIEVLESYGVRKIREGWDLDFTEDERVGVRVRLLLPAWFPYARPLIAVDADWFLKWPHIESDGVLCPLPDAATISPFDPAAVVDYVLAEAVALIEKCRSGENEDDFRKEFLSYWNRSKSPDSRPVLSLIENFNPHRAVSIWVGEQLCLIGENDKEVESWLRHRWPDARQRWDLQRAALVDVAGAPLPPEYPRDARQALSLIRAGCPDSERLLSSFLTSDSKPFILLTAPTENGPALAAIRMLPPDVRNARRKRVDVIQRGFRPGKLPPQLQMQRFIEAAPAPELLEVKRVDAAWIHGRGRNPNALELGQRKVVVLGIGSVGGFVAEHLTAAGIGDLTLVDDEVLVFANAGRHILGADSEGLSKAIAVAQLLQKRFPHHSIAGRQITAERFLEEQAERITDYDLILNLTGDWAADSFLNDLYLRAGGPRAVLFGWTEAHAVAGHAVMLSGKNGCFLCHTSDTGSPDFRVARWERPTTISEPACGGLFQPYGPVEIAAVNSMIASLAVETLLGKKQGNVHRVYATDDATIREVAGEVTAEWKQRRGTAPPDAKVVMTFDWDRKPDCRCGLLNAD